MKTNNSEQKIDQVLDSIHKGYKKLKTIEKDLALVREKKEILYSQD